MPTTEATPAARPPPMADLEPMHTDRRIVGLVHDASGVTLSWDDGRRTRSSALWLRDNCACPRCRHPQTLERTHLFVDHAAPEVVDARLAADTMLEVEFGGAGGRHLSRYTPAWLRRHDAVEVEARDRRHAPEPWDATLRTRLPTIGYDEYMQTAGGLRQWIEALAVHGIVLLRGVPPEPGRLLDVAGRIGPVRPSNFGATYDVVSMPNPNASAYTALGLELHTDLANWRSPPDVQLLCCLKSSVVGGDSVFADGYRVAADLAREEPAAFERLVRSAIEFRFHDESCDIRTRASVIELDYAGQVRRIRFNNWLRTALTLPPSQSEPLYGALERFWLRLRDPRYRLSLRLEPGDLIAYDNNRVLHGRAPFDPATGERHLQGCYLNQDDVDSTLRMLERVTGR